MKISKSYLNFLNFLLDNNVDEVYNQMFYDKKTSSGKIKIVALKKIGEAFIDSSNDVANIKKAIEYIAK